MRNQATKMIANIHRIDAGMARPEKGSLKGLKILKGKHACACDYLYVFVCPCISVYLSICSNVCVWVMQFNLSLSMSSLRQHTFINWVYKGPGPQQF